MSASEAWHQWVLDEEPALPPEWWDITRRAVMAGYRRALEDAAKEVAELVPYGYGMNPDGTEDRTAMAYVEGHREAWQVLKNRLASVGTKDGASDHD